MEEEVLDQLHREVSTIGAERDSLASRLKHAETEIDELRKTVNDAKSLKTLYDHLLQVSERILHD